MVGPFLAYAPPGVYSKTQFEQSQSAALGGLRIPVFIGAASETIRVDDLELFRGSSAQADILVVDEDLAPQIEDPPVNTVFVANIPVVRGDGTGRVTMDPQDVQIKLNGETIIPLIVDGNTGQIVLEQLPILGDTLIITYFFRRRDTLIENEDDSAQADGDNLDFKVQEPPIVRGDDGGTPTTDIDDVKAFVNDVQVAIDKVFGADGVVRLKVPPMPGDEVLITYFTNRFQNTFDFLPNRNVVKVIRVGLAPGREDFVNTVDFVVRDNKIYWGSFFFIEAGDTEPGTLVFDEDFIQATLRDNFRFKEFLGVGDGVLKNFILVHVPVDGSGQGKDTELTNLVTVFVGPTVGTAVPVTVAKIDAETKVITLKDAPALGMNVFADYFYSLIKDDIFTLEVTEVDDCPDGKYKITSQLGNIVRPISEGAHAVANPNFLIEGIIWPFGSSPDLQTIPGASIPETITLTFIDATDFTVVSDQPGGSTGSGTIGQTYIDAVTGVRFSVMPPISFAYQAGDILRFVVGVDSFSVSPILHRTVPGFNISVQDTTGTFIGNQGLLHTFNKSGQEPAIAEFYNISYEFQKDDYTTQIFSSSRFGDILVQYGILDVANPLVVAAFLAIQNGALLLGLKQVLKDKTTGTIPETAFVDALTELSKPLVGSVNADLLVPINASVDFFDNLKEHVERMSSERFRSERIAIVGVPVGTTVETVKSLARGLRSRRMRLIFPDGATMAFQDELGREVEKIVDGSLIAAAFAGLDVSPRFDVAEPMTRKQIVGLRRLLRRLDEVELNAIAIEGVCIIEEFEQTLRIRHDLTTDVSSVLTREASITKIIDFVARTVRRSLDTFIGQKNLPGRLQDIELSIASILRSLIQQEVIQNFRAIQARLDDADPTIVRVSLQILPVFPLNWITITFNVRSKF